VECYIFWGVLYYDIYLEFIRYVSYHIKLCLYCVPYKELHLAFREPVLPCYTSVVYISTQDSALSLLPQHTDDKILRNVSNTDNIDKTPLPRIVRRTEKIKNCLGENTRRWATLLSVIFACWTLKVLVHKIKRKFLFPWLYIFCFVADSLASYRDIAFVGYHNFQ
jgi:hypothetical protein